MKPCGFSLVELLVVIALFSILMALAVMPFGTMNRRSAIEKQITEMYQEIVRAQQQAMQTRRRYRVTFNPNTLVIERLVGDVVAAPEVVEAGSTVTKGLPLTINTPPAIVFNTKGIMTSPIDRSICIFSDAGPNVDSIVIVESQVTLGQIINQGAACGTPNINRK